MEKIQVPYKVRISPSKLFHKSWKEAFDRIVRSNYFFNLMVLLDKLYNQIDLMDIGLHIRPRDKKVIFEGFRKVPFHRLKVVILVEKTDDFYTVGGQGINSSDQNMTPVLYSCIGKMQKSIEKRFYNGLNLNFDTTLTNWTRQGVLTFPDRLIGNYKRDDTRFQFNHVSTVFTANAIEAISHHKDSEVIFVFLGESLKRYEKYIDQSKHTIIFGDSPFENQYSAKKYEWNSSCLEEVNAVLTASHKEPIKW